MLRIRYNLMVVLIYKLGDKMRKKIMFGMLVMMFFASSAYALESGYCVNFEVTDISPTSVEIGDDVTVGMQLDNCGDILPPNVNFEITRFSDDITIREPLINNFDEPFGYSNSQRFSVYHLYVTGDATPGEYIFEYMLSYGNGDFMLEKEGSFSITVTSQESDLNIAYVKTEPILPTVGEEVTLTIRLENFGRGDANSVKASIDLPFFGIKESFLGELEAGDDSSAVFTIVPDRAGVIDYDLTVVYIDDFGEHEFSESLELNIQEDMRKSNVLAFVGVGGVVLLIALLAYYFRPKKALTKKEAK